MSRFHKVGLVLLLATSILIGVRCLTGISPSVVGVERNSLRENLGIPLVSQDWSCTRVSQNYFLCSGHDSTGHIGKEIKFRGKEVLLEKDTYILNCSNKPALRVIIESRFSPDTLVNAWTEDIVFERSKISMSEFKELITNWEKCVSSN